MKLNKDQLARLKREFFFDESEEINYAEYKGDNTFIINIYDMCEDLCWDYLPSPIEEGKTNYILYGKDY